MDAESVRAAVLRNFELSGSDPVGAHSMYHPDAVLEFPQSGERFEGVANFREWRSGYPADVRFIIDRVRGGGDVWVVEVRVSYDGKPWDFGVSVLEFRDDLIARETIYWGQAWEAPEWRARWRAAPPVGTAAR